MPKKEKLSFSIIFDTNILRSDPINKDVLALYGRYSSRGDCLLKYFIPEVVLLEFRRHFDSFIEKNVGKYESSASVLNLKTLRLRKKERKGFGTLSFLRP